MKCHESHTFLIACESCNCGNRLIPGPPGPKGDPGCCSKIKGITAILNNGCKNTLSDNKPIIYNEIKVKTTDKIEYDNNKGEFKLLSPGTYFADWWICTDGSEKSTIMSFEFIVNDKNNNIIYEAISCSPIVTGTVSGNTLFTITKDNIPAKVSIKNNTGSVINFANTPYQSLITILSVIE